MSMSLLCVMTSAIFGTPLKRKVQCVVVQKKVTVCCGMLQRVAARCSALQRVAARCSALQRVATRCSALIVGGPCRRYVKSHVQKINTEHACSNVYASEKTMYS